MSKLDFNDPVIERKMSFKITRKGCGIHRDRYLCFFDMGDAETISDDASKRHNSCRPEPPGSIAPGPDAGCPSAGRWQYGTGALGSDGQRRQASDLGRLTALRPKTTGRARGRPGYVRFLLLPVLQR